MGKPCRAAALPLERFGELPVGPEPWVKGGPVGPCNAMICGAWWMTREVELSCTRAKLVRIEQRREGLVASWALPSSKADQTAVGVERTHGCCCSVPGWASLCPAHAMLRQIEYLRCLFPSKFDSCGIPADDLPLFPSSSGEPCTKDTVFKTIEQTAVTLGLPMWTSDGLRQWTGHSLRVTGAQNMAKAGLDTWIIQLLGRWGSQAVRTYIRDAPLTTSHRWARQ
eukprot:2797216-Karenia_brevis.AAC.1